jgi:hypothetical protein
MGRVYLFSLAICGFLCIQAAAHCPFCGVSGQTLAQEAASASLILYGTPKNAKLDPKDFAQGTTELDIEAVIKSHKILADRKTITLQKYLPQPDPKNPQKLLVFCEVYKNELDPYRGTPFGQSVVSYLQGAIALKDKPTGERLRFFFDYLNDSDASIATDAFMEFGNADYKDMRPVAEKLPADLIVGWLRDPGLALSRLGLFASILGHCGKPADAQLLKEILEDPKRRFSGGVDGVLAGLIMLDPKEGWKYLADLVNDSKKDFLIRHAALRTARFFWEYRPDVVDRKQVAATIAAMIDQPDIADMAIEDLRKWSCWAPASKVLGLLKNKEFDTLLIRRSIVRYMLRCPPTECPEAASFISGERKRDPQYVKDIESLLRQESGDDVAPTKASAGK